MPSYAPVGALRNTRSGDPSDPRERGRPELPPPDPTPDPSVPPGGTLPTEPDDPGTPPTPGGPGPGGPSGPTPGGPPPGVPPGAGGGEIPTIVSPGDATAAAPYRTPAFFTNRFAGGDQGQPVRLGAGAPLAGGAGGDAINRPQLDPAVLRALIAKFGGAAGGGGM